MNIQEYLHQTGLSVSELSVKCGLPYSTVSEIVNGKKSIGKCSTATIYALATSLGTTVENLLRSEKEESYPDKYSMDEKEALFLGKKKWDENVYCGMKMEARNVTFPQTKTILDGINVPGVSLDDIIAIRNMRDAWRYILSSLSEKLTMEYVMRLNSFISRDESLEWGVLRSGNVGVSGTSYLPPIPEKDKTERELNAILNSYKTTTEKALDIFCLVSRNQWFWEGNKRTALSAANKLLLSEGKGIITIQDHNMEAFSTLLCSFYDSGDSKELKDFLYETSIQGIGK